MANSYPQYVADILATQFTPDQLAIIDANFHWYSDGFRFSSASERGIIAQAKMVLRCALTIENYPCGPSDYDFERKCAKPKGAK